MTLSQSAARAPRGTDLSCQGWEQEGLLRMMMNCLDPEVAENPHDLIVYGGTGKAARSWEAFEAIAASLRELGPAETLLIQSGKPVGVLATAPQSPRVVMSTAMLVPKWATWNIFRELEDLGLTCFGQSTAASWSYIGAQGILQSTAEVFSEVARRYFGGTLRGRLVVTAGLGGMGAAQPLAVTLNGGVALVVEVDEGRIRRRLASNYCDMMVRDLGQALSLAGEALTSGQSRSIALLGNAADILPALLERDVVPDVVTDQTSAHDMLFGYIPNGMPYAEALELRRTDPEAYKAAALDSICRHVRAMLEMMDRGAVVFEYGNGIRDQALKAGVERAFAFPGYVNGYLQPLYCQGQGAIRWIALSGDPGDIYAIDESLSRRFAADANLVRWLEFVQSRVAFQGLPARACWLTYEQRQELGVLVNEMVRKGTLSAPVAITRDLSHTGAEASPYRETEGMPDGSDTVADWPVLNALLNAACGASMVCVNHGPGVGIGNSIHAGYSVIADGSELAGAKLRSVLAADCAFSVVRFADAGSRPAVRKAIELGLKVPLLPRG
ncbi:MAG: urocanate hydratase [Bacillota bacterium]